MTSEDANRASSRKEIILIHKLNIVSIVPFHEQQLVAMEQSTRSPKQRKQEAAATSCTTTSKRPRLTTADRRRCTQSEDSSYTAKEEIHPNDVFDRVMKCIREQKEQQQQHRTIGNRHAAGSESQSLSLGTPTSWLRVQWLSDTTRSSSTAATPTKSERLDIPQEIQGLQKKLLQHKRRLGPLAEQLAEAIHRRCHDPTHRHTSNSSSFTSHELFLQARQIVNPFEVLGSGLFNTRFMNRSAMKLANMDQLVQFRLIKEKSNNQRNEHLQPYYFADICGAPGGFTEYIFYRLGAVLHSKQSAVGYGMSLQGNNAHGKGLPWKLYDCDWMEDGVHFSYRICNGIDQTGDILNFQNIKYLGDQIASSLDGCQKRTGQQAIQRVVDLVVADGGFDAQRDNENQEEIASKLITSEIAAALAILKLGGSLVVKMFGFQSGSSRLLLLDLQSRFEDLLCVKPITSRPASAERYLICFGLLKTESLEDLEEWRDRICRAQTSAIAEDYSPKGSLQYFDTFDRDMLDLNCRACSAILSILDEKLTVVQQSPDEEMVANDPVVEVDIDGYKEMWCL